MTERQDLFDQDDVLRTLEKFLEEEKSYSPAKEEADARACLSRFVHDASTGKFNWPNFHAAVKTLERLLATTKDRPGVLAQALGHIDEDGGAAERRALFRTMQALCDSPVPLGLKGAVRPKHRGHRVSFDVDKCLLCGASGSPEKGWRVDCPKNPPQGLPGKAECAEYVAVAAERAGLRSMAGSPIDSESVLKQYQRWTQEGQPRERKLDKLVESFRAASKSDTDT